VVKCRSRDTGRWYAVKRVLLDNAEDYEPFGGVVPGFQLREAEIWEAVVPSPGIGEFVRAWRQNVAK
jgi:hypothetical protein